VYASKLDPGTDIKYLQCGKENVMLTLFIPIFSIELILAIVGLILFQCFRTSNPIGSGCWSVFDTVLWSFFIISLIVGLIGLFGSIIYSGIWYSKIKDVYENWNSDASSLLTAVYLSWVFIVVLLVVAVVGGCMVKCLDNSCFTVFYITVLIIFFLAFFISLCCSIYYSRESACLQRGYYGIWYYKQTIKLRKLDQDLTDRREIHYLQCGKPHFIIVTFFSMLISGAVLVLSIYLTWKYVFNRYSKPKSAFFDVSSVTN
jgi:hypothetical protein